MDKAAPQYSTECNIQSPNPVPCARDAKTRPGEG